MAIYALGDLEPTIASDAYVHPDAVVIGDVRIGSESSIWPGVVMRGDSGPIFVGERTSIQDGSVIHTTEWANTRVGNGCVVGHMVHLEGCTIEDDALVGSGSVVLHNVVVRSGGLVGANAVCPEGMEVPAGAMALGIPAKLRLDSVDPMMIKVSADHYVGNGKRFARDLRRLD
ncbi:gamma carbonic anhydrase family protein [Actinospongicola halichondriae]|uniref:gamma carbonic anhydrase family protein n=1 Tax=Actinospongicola halichondriae TaxID=3236844 RepID=UPI003D5AE663